MRSPMKMDKRLAQPFPPLRFTSVLYVSYRMYVCMYVCMAVVSIQLHIIMINIFIISVL